jgi:hypothetical protein
MVRRPRKLGIGEVKNDFPSQNVGRGPIKSKPAVTGLWTPVKYFLGRWGLGELFRSNKYYRFPPKTKKKTNKYYRLIAAVHNYISSSEIL